jgi:UDP-N-acetylglucosamine 3-dehydrogenase
VIRVGVVGCGRMGARHVAALAQTDGAALAAVADPDAEARRRALAGRLVPDFYDWRDLADHVDAVVVACPSDQHADVAADALRRGLHVLVEKPLALRLDDAVRLIDLAEDAGRVLMVGHVERFNPAVARLRDEVQAGTVGRIIRAHAARTGPPPGSASAGVALDLATHDLDLLEYVLGSPLFGVIADGYVRGDGLEALVTCLLRFGNGSHGLLEASWMHSEKRRVVELVGWTGVLRADLVAQEVWLHQVDGTPSAWPELAVLVGDGDGAAFRLGVRREEPLRAELAAFAAACETGVSPVTGQDGYRALAAALSIRDQLRQAKRWGAIAQLGDRAAA